MSEVVKLKILVGADLAPAEVVGRFAWTLAELIAAGEHGVTPIERPAPRWSHYVYKLRRDKNLNIETVEERARRPLCRDACALCAADAGSGSRDGASMSDQVLAEFAKNSRETVRIALSHYKGHDLLQLRSWVLKEDGTAIPTKHGLSLRVAVPGPVHRCCMLHG